MHAPGPLLDLVVPVYNEEDSLEASVRRLSEHLATMPFEARVSIVDNASTDGTWALASRLAAELDDVRAIRLEQKGRGRALRAAWTESDAEIVAYTDVDLSTDIGALLPLVEAVRDGADVAIGSRLADGAVVTRGAKRELVSRSYNNIIKAITKATFSDAQCGFKAVRADVARRLLPEVENENWFFDTELLLLAEHHGLRIAEVPVAWVDDPTSTVKITATALEDLKGLLRLTRRLLGQRDAGTRGLQRAVVSFAVVGSCTTLLHLGLLAVLRGSLGSLWANAVALAIATPVNTALNRLATFGYRGRHRLARDHAEAGVVFLGGLAATTIALTIVDSLWVVLVANGTVTLLRFLLLRAWVFHPARRFYKS
jgi:putative flippase GtrA